MGIPSRVLSADAPEYATADFFCTKKRWLFAKESGVTAKARAATLFGLNSPAKQGRREVAAARSAMSMEDTIGFRNRTPACAVCGKNVEHGRGFVRIKHGERLVELCCPLCLETFQKDPLPYVKKLQRIDYFRELSELEARVKS